MDHYLITRFNIRVHDWTETRSGFEVNNSDWLEHRFQLFETYCLPSVKNQSDQRFSWLVFFDQQTPEDFKLRISGLERSYENFKPIYIDGIEEFLPALRAAISQNSTDTHLITSRVDNDDLLHRDYIKMIKELSEPKEELIIDLRRGYQMTIAGDKVQLRNYIHRLNPFLSLVEENDKPVTVMHRNHRDWKRSKSIKAYNEKPLWIEFIHERNKLNAVRNNLTLSYSKSLLEFGIKEPLSSLSWFYITIWNARIKLNRLVIKANRLFLKK